MNTGEGRGSWGRRHLWSGVAFLGIVACVAFCLFRPAPANRLRIAYIRRVVPVVAQVGQVLERTDILENNGLKADFYSTETLDGFREGSAEVDVLITGEADTLTRIVRGQRGRVAATLGSGGRIGIVVRPGSDIRRLQDLRGRTLALTPGNALHRWVVSALATVGVDDDDVQIVGYKGEQTAQDPDVDAVVLWDPMLYVREQKGTARVLAESQYWLTVFFAERLFTDDRDLGVAMLVALREAALYMAREPQRTAGWWAAGTGVPTFEAAHYSSSWNHLYLATSMDHIDLSLANPRTRASLELDNRFLVERGFFKEPLDLDRVLDTALYAEAVAATPPDFDPAQVGLR